MPSKRATAGRFVRLVLALFLLASIAGFQTAAAVTEQVHSHHQSHSDCCQICHAGHASAIQPALGFTLEAPLAVEWRSITEAAPGTPECQIELHPSRAPPC